MGPSDIPSRVLILHDPQRILGLLAATFWARPAPMMVPLKLVAPLLDQAHFRTLMRCSEKMTKLCAWTAPGRRPGRLSRFLLPRSRFCGRQVDHLIQQESGWSSRMGDLHCVQWQPPWPRSKLQSKKVHVNELTRQRIDLNLNPEYVRCRTRVAGCFADCTGHIQYALNNLLAKHVPATCN